MMSVTCFMNYLMAAGSGGGGRWGQRKNRIIYELIIVETRRLDPWGFILLFLHLSMFENSHNNK